MDSKIFHVNEFLEQEDLEFVKQTINSYIDNKDRRAKTEAWTENSTTGYDIPELNVLLEIYKDKVSSIIGKNVIPKYTFWRKSFKGCNLPYHLDRPVCEVSLTINIESENNSIWPFFLDHTSPKKYLMKANDAIIYGGYDYVHWRHPLEHQYNIQFCMHYVLEDGCFANMSKDGDWKDVDRRSPILQRVRRLDKDAKKLNSDKVLLG